MPFMIVTQEAEAALRSQSDGTLAPLDKRPDGTYRIFVSDETSVVLSLVHFEGETLSDTIVRLCATFGRAMN